MIIGAILGFFFGCYFLGERGARFLAGLVGSVMGIAVSVIISTLIIHLAPTETVVYSHVELVALKDNTSGVSGSFFIGSGTIQTRSYYFFYARNQDGSYYQDKVSTESANIYEEDRTDGALKTYVRRPQGNWRYFCLFEKRYTYCFYIPKGSIPHQFRLDLNS